MFSTVMDSRLNKFLLLMSAVLTMAASCSGNGQKVDVDASHHRSIYYWKTSFEIGQEEQSFLDRHDIDRIYLRMFDVDAKEDYAADTTRVIPVATAQFRAPKPESIEIVPTVFITLNALRHYEGNEEALAALITKRVLNMCSYNDLGPVAEVQFDCDWSESTRGMFDRLCEAAKKILHEKGILLSGTIRLHQVEQAEYPFDKGVLMLYNTGAIKDPETSNSIIAYDDVKKYLGVQKRVDRFLKARESNCTVVDFAYPTFHWNVVFTQDGRFDGIISEIDYESYPLTKKGDSYVADEWFIAGSTSVWSGETIRPEFSDIKEVRRVKNLVSSTIGATGSNIIYHLDISNLSKYSDHEIEDILR